LDAIRVLLIQARNTEEMELQEQTCFVERARIDLAQFIPVNVVRDPIHLGLLDGVDALMIGGAGEYSALDDDPWMTDVLALVKEAYDRDLPTFGSCWGHQLIARALGGMVIYDKERSEFGCGEIELTAAAADDPLFQGLPPCFRANLGHHDRVVALPPAAVELAFNVSQRNQAFRLGNKPFYGTQFHSELNAERERERLIAYRDLYLEELGSDADFQAVMDSLADTTEADHLLYDFLRLFVVDQVSIFPTEA
ncbi:MAG TPA: type 1 glutamine amidotransferase, partial [Rhodothermales bacterium]|nr:type 1 glutamine amidotransferase [Rhodothermales bacterium]